jgi:hypothetical protein
MRLFWTALAAVMLAAPAVAQQHDHAAPSCTAMDATLPAGLEDWNGGHALKTISRGAELGDITLTLGKGYAAGLARTASIVMTVEPEKPGGSVSWSGLFAFNAPEAGKYSVALGSAAWVDVVEDGKALEPLSFGHGPACTTIRKIVVYDLKPGSHQLQVAGNGADTIKLLVAKQP